MKNKNNNKKNTVVILHNIRSAYNVGSIFRTADAVGASKVILSGYTPSPIDNFGRSRKDIAKTALGAELNVKWQKSSSIAKTIKKLKHLGHTIIAVEQAHGAIDYKKLSIKKNTTFIFGNEVRGLSKSILEKTDKVIHISMYGEKESLNVSVAAGIILFSALDN